MGTTCHTAVAHKDQVRLAVVRAAWFECCNAMAGSCRNCDIPCNQKDLEESCRDQHLREPEDKEHGKPAKYYWICPHCEVNLQSMEEENEEMQDCLRTFMGKVNRLADVRANRAR